MRRLAAAAAVVLLAMAFEAAAARQPAEPRFRSRVDVVAITATVRDAGGALVAGLTRDDFEVFEDGVRQPITQFTAGRVPVGLGLLLDVSDSMRGRRIEDARTAVRRFLVDLLDPADEFFVVAFNHEPRLIAPWMQGPNGLEARLEALRPWGGTAMYDAVLHALPILDQRSSHRAAIVIISDGADTASDASVRDVRLRLLRSDAFVYAIAVDPPGQRRSVTRVNPGALRQITDESGGRTAVVRDTDEIAAATEQIAEELNKQYVLGFTSSRPADGEYHSLRVRVKKPGFRVQSRRGYVAGT